MRKAKLDYKKTGLPLYKVALTNTFFGFVLNLFMNYRFIYSPLWIIEVCLNSMIIGTIIWKGSEQITIIMVEKYPLLTKPIKRLSFSFLYIFLLSLASVTIFNTLWRVIFHEYSVQLFFRDLPLIVGLCLVLPVLANLIIYSVIFFRNWKQSVISEEVLKREQLALQYESLKTQVNPQLLFNSLKVLSKLVHKDADASARYIKLLSEIYRYSLDQKDKEIVELEEELKFIKSYSELLEMQYQLTVEVNINIQPEKNTYILPLSLQMLIEDTVESHNFELQPLCKISIQVIGNYLIFNNITNTLAVSENNKLENIKSRYAHLTEKPFFIDYKDESRLVHIPLLNKEL